MPVHPVTVVEMMMLWVLTMHVIHVLVVMNAAVVFCYCMWMILGVVWGVAIV